MLIKSLTIKSKSLLESVEAKMKETALPMWRLFCYAHGTQVWKSQIYQEEGEIYSSQEFQDHLPHGNINIVDDKDNDFKLF